MANWHDLFSLTLKWLMHPFGRGCIEVFDEAIACAAIDDTLAFCAVASDMASACCAISDGLPFGAILNDKPVYCCKIGDEVC